MNIFLHYSVKNSIFQHFNELFKLLCFGGFLADFLGHKIGVSGLDLLGRSLAQRVHQLGEELRDAGGRITCQVLADGTNNGIDILTGNRFELNTSGIQDQVARNQFVFKM